MTIKYYLRYCLWGFIGCGYLIYTILNDLNEGKIYPAYIPYMPYVAAYLLISALAFPFDFYVFEKITLKVMKKETWNDYFGSNSPSWSAFPIIYLLCVIFSLPLLMCYPFINKKR